MRLQIVCQSGHPSYHRYIKKLLSLNLHADTRSEYGVGGGGGG